MPELRDLLHASAPRPTTDLDTRQLERRVIRRRRSKRWVAGAVALLIVVSLTATLTNIVRDASDDDPIDVVTRPPTFEEPLQTWTIPGIRAVAAAGDHVRVLMQRGQSAGSSGPGGSWSVDRLDLATGTPVEPVPVEGSSLSMTSSDGYVWVWGQILGDQIQEALRRGDKELPTSGRLGVVHRIDPSGHLESWTLTTVPLFLVTRGSRAWASTIDFANNDYGLAEFDGDARPRVTDAPNAEWGLVLDGDRLWFNGTGELVAIDIDSREILERFRSRRLAGRTVDGQLWEQIASERVAPFERVPAERTDLPLAATAGAPIVQLGEGVVIGPRWFPDPGARQEAAAELAQPAGLYLQGPIADPSGAAVLYTGQRGGDSSPHEVLLRWVPHKAAQAPTGLPSVEPPSVVEAGCAPYIAGYISHNSGEWGESTIVDPDLPGAIRRIGVAGAYVQVFPGRSRWLSDLPDTEVQPSLEGIGKLHLARTTDGYAAVALPVESPRQAPCDGVTVIGHHLTRAEMIQQVENLVGLAPYTDGSAF
jgi:hypothetical protein